MYELVEEEEELSRLKEELKEYKNFSEDIPWSAFERYEKIKSHLKEERRLLKILQKQSAETLSNELSLALEFANNGTLVSLKTLRLKGKVIPAVIIEKIQKGKWVVSLNVNDNDTNKSQKLYLGRFLTLSELTC